MLEISSLSPCTNYRLRVVYANGVEGQIDLSHLVGKGVFKAWNDPNVFESVHIGEHGEIRWNEDIELCADAVYMQLTGKTAEEIFPDLKAPADA